MVIATIQDLIAYLENGTAYAEALKLDDDQLELVHSLAMRLTYVAADELAFRRRIREQRHD